MNEFPVFNHETLFSERFLTHRTCCVVRWIYLDMCLLMMIEIPFGAQHFSANPTNELHLWSETEFKFLLVGFLLESLSTILARVNRVNVIFHELLRLRSVSTEVTFQKVFVRNFIVTEVFVLLQVTLV